MYLSIYKGTCLIEKISFSLILNVIVEQCLELMNLRSQGRGKRRKVTFKNHCLSQNLYLFRSSPCSLTSHRTPKPTPLNSQSRNAILPKSPTLSIHRNGTVFISFCILHESGAYICPREKSSALSRHCYTFHPLKLQTGLSLEFPKLPR